MKRQKPKVGDILYSLNVGNAARHEEQKLTKKLVVKVGRKYFYVAKPEYAERDNMWTAFWIKNWRQKTDFSETESLYGSKREWEDHRESAAICRKVIDAFEYGRNNWDLSIDQLRKIEAIMEGCEEVNVSIAENLVGLVFVFDLTDDELKNMPLEKLNEITDGIMDVEGVKSVTPPGGPWGFYAVEVDLHDTSETDILKIEKKIEKKIKGGK